jgi:3-deoxy-manno-octulosonate cytidylyltransferase (CMP-KDO synthetase)
VIGGVIPVRMESRRLPGKPLRPICGRPMVAWVYERAHANHLFDRLTVATDSETILDYCAEQRIPVVRTSAQHSSGTSRLIEVMDQDCSRGRAADIYVNIQGDEPMVTARHVELLLKPFLCPGHTNSPQSFPQTGPGVEVANRDRDSSELLVSTLRVAISPEAAADPNTVKVVTDSHDRALYFSRAPIPYHRDAAGEARYYKHLGLYAYTVDALQRFRSVPASPLEQTEQLEQLRFLENGIPITVVETTEDTIGVDTEEDLRRVEEYFRRAGIASPLGCVS